MSIQIVRSQQSQRYSTVEILQKSVSTSIVQQFVTLQTYQSSLSQNSVSQIQINTNSFIQKILKTFMKNKKISFTETEADKRIEFFRKLTKLKKIFRLSVTVILKNIRVMLNKNYTQTDQDFEMNVISSEMIRKLKLIHRSLTKIELADLIMKTTDHKKIKLHSWTELILKVEKIIKTIKYFIDSKSYDLFENITNQYRFLLSLLWLYSVNVVINIRSSFIQIDDITFHETVRIVIDFELVFSEDHNLLMYSKSNFSKDFESKKEMKSHENEFEKKNDFDDDFDESENNLSDVKKMQIQQQNFQ